MSVDCASFCIHINVLIDFCCGFGAGMTGNGACAFQVGTAV